MQGIQEHSDTGHGIRHRGADTAGHELDSVWSHCCCWGRWHGQCQPCVGQVCDLAVPAEWIERWQNRNKFYYYHQKFRRVPDLSQCLEGDYLCYYEAEAQWRRDRYGSPWTVPMPAHS